MERIRMGIVGCGCMGRGRAGTIRQLPNQELTVVMDTNEAAAKSLAAETRAAWATELKDVWDRVAALYVATPHALHAETVLEAASRGKHVLVDKPLATRYEDGLAMVEACRKAGVVLAVGYQRRFLRESPKVKALVESGSLGQILHVTNTYNAFFESDRWDTWRGDPAINGGGILFDTGVHCIDIVRYVTGLEADEVFCHRDSHRSPKGVEDVASVLVTYRGTGARGHIEVMSSAVGDSRIRIGSNVYGSSGMHIYGTEGHIYWEGYINIFPLKGLEGLKAGEWNQIPFEPTNAEADLHTDFADAILSGKKPGATGEDGLATIDFILAAYESADSNAPVKLKNLHLSRMEKRGSAS